MQVGLVAMWKNPLLVYYTATGSQFTFTRKGIETVKLQRAFPSAFLKPLFSYKCHHQIIEMTPEAVIFRSQVNNATVSP